MKEIDFLPQWYKDKRRRQTNYRVQYIGLICLAVVMVTWTITTLNSISRAGFHLTAAPCTRADASEEFRQMRVELEQLHAEDAVLSRIDQRLRISGAIGELSFLSGNRVKFSRLRMAAEKFPEKETAGKIARNTIRAIREAMTDKSGPYEGDIRLKVTIAGIAADATYVAGFIRKLEESPWFFQVTPSYCRNTNVAGHVVSEFEITCYIANYTEQKGSTGAVAANAGPDMKGDI